MSLGDLCRLFGFTRQGLWKQCQSHLIEEIDATAMLSEVKRIRRDMPRLGVRKLQVLLSERGHYMSRDRLFDILRDSGLLVKRSHTRIITTYSRHWMKKWPNLIKDIMPSRPGEVWVSDITYIEIKDENGKSFMYLSLITDAYTHEIVGYALHHSLDTEGPLRALRMALASFPQSSLKGLIHHSDRGCQYCCQDYVRVLQEHGILISMTDNGDPYENAIAERLNGILKTEWLYHMTLKTPKQAHEAIDRIVYLYNNARPHQSIGYMIPVEARGSSGGLNRLWKNYRKIRYDQQQPVGEESPLGELPAADLSCSCRKTYTPAAVLT